MTLPNHAAAFAPQFFFCFVAHRFPSVLRIIGDYRPKTCALKTWLQKYRFPAKLKFSMLWTPGVFFFYWLAAFLYWHLPLRRCDMFKVTYDKFLARTENIRRAGNRLTVSLFACSLFKRRNLALDFLRESLLFKWINKVCRIDGFPSNLARTFSDR